MSPTGIRSRTVAMAGRALAPAGRPGARRAGAAAARMAGRARAARWRCRSTAITKPTNCATAASRSAGCPGVSTAPGSRVPRILKLLERHGVKATFYVPAVTALLHPDEQRRDRRRGPRDRHPRLDPRAELGAALRGRARPDAALGRHAGKDLRRPAGRHAHAVLGFQLEHAGDRRRDGAALRFLADGGRGLLRTAARRRADAASSNCRSNGCATTRSIS